MISSTQATEDDEHFKEMVLASPVAIYTCDSAGHITFFNRAAAELWGREPEIGTELWSGAWKMYDFDNNPIAHDTCPMALTLKEGKSYEGTEILIETPDHLIRHLLVFPRLMYNRDGIITGANNTLVDITGRKQDEEKQARLSAIVESSDDAIISKNLNGIIMSWNKGAQRIFGYTESEVTGKHISLLIPPTMIAEEDVIINNIKSGKTIDHFQTIRLHKSGREIPISLTVSPVRDKFGRVIGASKIARDISEQRKAEQTIKETAGRLEVLNNVGKIIAEKLDVQAILQHVTDATTSITGAAFGAFFYNDIDESGEVYMLYTLSGVPREAFANFRMPRNTAIFAPTFNGEGTVRLDDVTKDPRFGHNAPHYGMPKGHLPVVSYLAIPVISSLGHVIGGLFFGHPEPGVFTAEHEVLVEGIAAQAAVAIDNSRLFEEVKALSAKKDEFIALASHELKTPLTTIKGYLQVIDRTETNAAAKMFISKTLSQVEKLNALISDLLDISRMEAGKLKLDKEIIDLDELIREVTETLGYINKTHTINFKHTGEPLRVKADKQRIEQALINLITNAIKYSPAANQVHLLLEHTADNAVVKVRDEGIGLSPDQQKKIFTRFYRVEGNANISGLGLGLYLTKEIIDRHNGQVGVKSELGKGSEFFFSLPLSKNKQ